MAGDAYEAYIGRWSRRVAERFVRQLDVPASRRWLDVGCGTGALTSAVLAAADPAEVVAVDPSEGFLTTAPRRGDRPAGVVRDRRRAIVAVSRRPLRRRRHGPGAQLRARTGEGRRGDRARARAGRPGRRLPLGPHRRHAAD